MCGMARTVASLVVALVLAACSQVGGGGVFMVGKPAPAVHTKTLADVDGDLAKITSYRYPDPRMYRVSFDKALKMHKPIVLEFATPGHCTQCDQQLQLLKILLNEYENKVIFLHMDQYYNPEAYTAFQVRGEPWTFVMDANGIVRAVFPGRVLYQELRPVLDEVVADAAHGGAPAAPKKLASSGRVAH